MATSKKQQADQPSIPDGRWFQLKKVSYTEAELTEVVVKDGAVVSTKTAEDLSRIVLAKLVQRVTESYGEKADA